MRRLIVACLAVAISVACSSDPDFALTENAAPRIEYNSEVLLEYDENLHQMAFDNAKKEFRLTTDNMTDYFLVDLESIPTSVPSTIKVRSLQWSCADGIICRTNLKMQVVKIDGSNIWLWNSSDKIGLCISTLQ